MIGLVLTLLVPVCWAASRRHVAAAVLATTAGLTAAAGYDWSDDGSGLFVIGVGMVLAGSLVVTTAVSALIGALTRDSRSREPTGWLPPAGTGIQAAGAAAPSRGPPLRLMPGGRRAWSVRPVDPGRTGRPPGRTGRRVW